MKSVCVFCASSLGRDPVYERAAHALARALVDRGSTLVYGGGNVGLMGAVADEVLRLGGRAVGVIPQMLVDKEVAHRGVTDLRVVSSMHERKALMEQLADGFVALPGGFGTLDEMFELLTLVQTGKAQPAPLVLLDTPGGRYWSGLADWLRSQVASVGLISPEDGELFRTTDSVDATIEEIEGFYRNYHSIRHVGDRTVIRLQAAPTDEELEQLSAQFADILVDGTIRRTDPFPPEVAGSDNVELPRIVLRFDKHGWGRLRMLIDRLNTLGSAPAPGAKPPTSGHQARVDERLSVVEDV